MFVCSYCIAVFFRLFSHGLGIHLLEVEDVPSKKGKINPKDNHISFQTTNMNLLLSRLEEMNIEYVTAVVSDSGITVDQLFFHDPDGYMIEICNCQNFPVLPLSSACPIIQNTSSLIRSQTAPSLFGNRRSSEVSTCAAEAAASLMMENLAFNMMNFSI